MLSTSKSMLQALQFAAFKRTNPWYVIHAWIPGGISIEKSIPERNLPRYIHRPFQKQKEISFFAGLLPHYIIGIQIMGASAMIYNPAIFSSWISPVTLFDGLKIDQSKFEEYASFTRIKGKFITDGEDMIEEPITRLA